MVNTNKDLLKGIKNTIYNWLIMIKMGSPLKQFGLFIKKK
jgi:hypothetical protein